MKALLFGAPPDKAEVRPTPEDELETMLAGIPFGLHHIDDARLVRPDWVVTRPILSGICGSDAKLVLGDFNTGDIDNPMAAFSSLPHVPGHEVVAEVVALGPEARGLDVGQRVVLNPWLTCAPRGITPLCPPCQAGDLSLCWSFTKGDLGPGVHVGVITGAPGAWAEQLAAHDSMLIPVPDGISNEAAVLADPFSVSFHAIVRHPPPSSGRVLVYGAGALGLTSVAILKALYPGVEVGVVARFEAQRAMALQFGADAVFAHEPRLQLVVELATWSGAVLHQPLDACQPPQWSDRQPHNQQNQRRLPRAVRDALHGIGAKMAGKPLINQHAQPTQAHQPDDGLEDQVSGRGLLLSHRLGRHASDCTVWAENIWSPPARFSLTGRRAGCAKRNLHLLCPHQGGWLFHTAP